MTSDNLCPLPRLFFGVGVTADIVRFLALRCRGAECNVLNMSKKKRETFKGLMYLINKVNCSLNDVSTTVQLREELLKAWLFRVVYVVRSHFL